MKRVKPDNIKVTRVENVTTVAVNYEARVPVLGNIDPDMHLRENRRVSLEQHAREANPYLPEHAGSGAVRLVLRGPSPRRLRGLPSRYTLWTTRSHRQIGEHIAGAGGHRDTARIGEGLWAKAKAAIGLHRFGAQDRPRNGWSTMHRDQTARVPFRLISTWRYPAGISHTSPPVCPEPEDGGGGDGCDIDCDGVGIGQATAIGHRGGDGVCAYGQRRGHRVTRPEAAIARGGPHQIVSQIPVGGVGGLPGKGHGGATHYRCGCRRINNHNRAYSTARRRQACRSWDAELHHMGYGRDTSVVENEQHVMPRRCQVAVGRCRDVRPSLPGAA